MCVLWSHQVHGNWLQQQQETKTAASTQFAWTSGLTPNLSLWPCSLDIQGLTQNCPLWFQLVLGLHLTPVAHASAWAAWCPSQVAKVRWTVGGSLHSLISSKHALVGSEGLAVGATLRGEWEKTRSSGVGLGGQPHTPWDLLVLLNPVDFRSSF